MIADCFCGDIQQFLGALLLEGYGFGEFDMRLSMVLFELLSGHQAGLPICKKLCQNGPPIGETYRLRWLTFT